MMTEFTEYKHTYSGETKSFKCRLASKSDSELVIIYEPLKDVKFIGLNLERGCVSFGYYWQDRNYNVYHWKNPRGETVFYYYNICRDTKIGSDYVDWVDLIVDVAVRPGHDAEILDEDEIPFSMNRSDLRIIEDTKKHILSNLDQITPEFERKTAELAGKLSLFQRW